MFVIGWIAKAIHNRKLIAFVARIDPAVLQEIADHATSNEGRRELAVELVVAEAQKFGVKISKAQAEWLVDQAVRIVSKWVK